MRLWTVHPRYLDTKGLLAAWREGLLAQKVLKGETRGYRNHPQPARFKAEVDPVGAIALYLRSLHEEATARGYNFDVGKIEPRDFVGKLRSTRGQLLYEWAHLKSKLWLRDERRHDELKNVEEPDPHPLFEIVEGGVEEWEVVGVKR
ncbi:MAG: pyrimidine dimer DNA glycosylase/endonuclease V [Pyrinomonadaceae bacterium]